MSSPPWKLKVYADFGALHRTGARSLSRAIGLVDPDQVRALQGDLIPPYDPV